MKQRRPAINHSDKDIAIQIVNYNTINYLSSLLPDIIRDLSDSFLHYEINIIDNNSNDDLTGLIEKYRNINIHVLRSDKNVGFGAAHNLLSNGTKATYLLILNPDIRFIQDNTIVGLYNIISSHPDIKIAGPQLITKQGQAQEWDHGELEGILANVALYAGASYWRKRNNRTEVAWVSGACFMIEKQAFNAIGGFDPNFFLYKEEEDLCWRLRQKGLKIIYDPSISVMHYGSVVAMKSDHLLTSNRYFFEKHIAPFKHYYLAAVVHRILQRIGFYP